MRTLLVANRGEIALRIFRTCRAMDIATVAVYSTADADALHVSDADIAVALPGPPETAYLDREALVAAARATGADAVHPGYGFLAEDAAFAAAVAEAGLVFVGPPPAAIAAMGDKLVARRIATAVGIPVVLGGPVDDRRGSGFPVLVKAASGGGGRGMRRVDRPEDLDAAVLAASREAASVFGDERVYVEELIDGARHIEVQVLADSHGEVVHLYDRECSIQRRYQKLIEEAPAPGLDPGLRAELAAAACRLAGAVAYVGAGTVEFLVDGEGGWWFLEMNTRLQVEHPVTEAVTGIDLVAEQIRIARGGRPFAQVDIPPPITHAIEARLLAEDPRRGDLPQTGVIGRFEIPAVQGVRVDTGVDVGSTVTPLYDPLLAKVIATAGDRSSAVALLASTLARTRVHGITTNRDLLVNILRHRDFMTAQVDTGWLEWVGKEVRLPLLASPDEAVAAAALAMAAGARTAATVMTTIPAGFRNVAAAPETRSFDTGDAVVEVAYRMNPVEAQVGDARWEAVVDPSGTVDMVGEGWRRRYQVAMWPDRVVVDAAEGSLDLVEVPRFRPPAPSVAVGSLAAQVPGRVVAVGLNPGDEVAAGDALVVIESMKMEHTVAATEAGTVTSIATIGDAVVAGQVVAVVEPSTG